MTLTKPQARVLRFLRISGEFVTDIEVESFSLLDDGDHLALPSLVERGWAEVGPGSLKNCFRITAAGRTMLAEEAKERGR